MQARIYRPAKTSMQSGTRNTEKWVLKFESNGKFRERVMDWVASNETMDQVVLYFETLEAATSYAQKNNINYIIIHPNERKRIIKSYADNFTD